MTYYQDDREERQRFARLIAREEQAAAQAALAHAERPFGLRVPADVVAHEADMRSGQAAHERWARERRERQAADRLARARAFLADETADPAVRARVAELLAELDGG